MIFTTQLGLICCLFIIINIGHAMHMPGLPEWLHPPAADARGQSKSTTAKRVQFNFYEDSCLIEVVMQHGPEGWRKVAEHMPGRTARQCRDRWNNYLDPVPKSRPLPQEVANIIKTGFKEKKTSQAISREVFNKQGIFIAPNIIAGNRQQFERPAPRREIGMVPPGAMRPPPQPSALDPQPGDQLITDLNRQWGL
ncbi:MAG: SANT/Myb domain-containing protein, partial [Holosporales bacterium]|nr:SANT/Myb domain-containing protein [Holosporales bacterium]